MTSGKQLLDELIAGSVDPAAFSHRNHVAAAFAALDEYEFFEALALYAKGLRTLTEIAGVPEKYNATLTMGFMSLIAEAKAAHPEKSVDDLIATCAEISSPGALTSKFSAERLNGPLTRSIGLLPDRA